MSSVFKRYLRTTDFFYLFLCLAVSSLSIVTLFSVGKYGNLNLGGVWGNLRPAYTQILASVLGVVGAVIVSCIDCNLLLRYWPVHVAICWGLVLLTFVPGIGYEPAGTGSHSWISLPFGMSFQPTELAKISFILTFAHHLDKVRETLNHPKTMFPILCHLGLPALVVHLQGDDGTAIVFLAIGGIMLVAAGLGRWVVAACTLGALVAAWPAWHYLLSPYQRERIVGLFNPGPYAHTIMHQQLRARQAIGNGGLLGQGLFNGSHTYIPRAENDFIFSYFAESCGFIGCLLLLGLLFTLIFKTLHIATASASRAPSYVCIGVFAALFFQSLINIGMNVMLLPVMGITLPFFTAGGSSVLMLYLSAGLVLSVARHKKVQRLGFVNNR